MNTKQEQGALWLWLKGHKKPLLIALAAAAVIVIAAGLYYTRPRYFFPIQIQHHESSYDEDGALVSEYETVIDGLTILHVRAWNQEVTDQVDLEAVGDLLRTSRCRNTIFPLPGGCLLGEVIIVEGYANQTEFYLTLGPKRQTLYDFSPGPVDLVLDGEELYEAMAALMPEDIRP